MSQSHGEQPYKLLPRPQYPTWDKKKVKDFLQQIFKYVKHNRTYSPGWTMLWSTPGLPACAWPCDVASLTRLHGCSATARIARYFPHLCKQVALEIAKMVWGHDFAFLFFPVSTPLSAIWLHKCLQAIKKNQMCQCKWEHTAVKLFWILTNCLFFWQWKGGRWERGLLKPHAEVITKTEYVQGIFHSVAPWQTAGRGTLRWQDHRWRKANCRKDRSCRLQGEKCTVTSAGPSDGSRTGICFRCGISMTGSPCPPDRCSAGGPGTLQPSDYPRGMDCFPTGDPLWGEQGHWQKSSAVVCRVLICTA